MALSLMGGTNQAAEEAKGNMRVLTVHIMLTCWCRRQSRRPATTPRSRSPSPRRGPSRPRNLMMSAFRRTFSCQGKWFIKLSTLLMGNENLFRMHRIMQANKNHLWNQIIDPYQFIIIPPSPIQQHIYKSRHFYFPLVYRRFSSFWKIFRPKNYFENCHCIFVYILICIKWTLLQSLHLINKRQFSNCSYVQDCVRGCSI